MSTETTESGELAVVGCFTTRQRQARGTGPRVFRYAGGAQCEHPHWEHLGQLDGIVNPSFLLADRTRNVIYAAHGDSNVASAYAIDPASGGLTPLGEADTNGGNGVAVARHPSGRFLFVASYSSGSVSTLPVKDDGSLADATHRLDLPGATGPHKTEQAASHPHDAVFDPSGQFLIVPDKGLDRVFVLRADELTGELSVVSHASVRPGAGPRHVTFHPVLPRAYVIDEIDSTVVSLAWDPAAGRLAPLHVVPALPDSFFGHSTAAEIVMHPSGRFLYTSNRGADTVTRFEVDEGGDRLTPRGWTASGGREPRYMTLSPGGDRLVVANEQGDNITEFAIDPRDGTLRVAATVATASPSAIAFLSPGDSHARQW